ncbi:MAG: branched-chain amino acid transport system ATP-binding protein, partial [Actinomycetota bacterium]|nr:branched-chain amino acid transport system ATP-binding protein [Actinomycetota bacterium]
VADVRVRRAAWLDRFPVLAARLDEPAAALSGGQQQLLAIGRVLSARPRVLLADEPTAGLSPAIALACGQALVDLAAEGAAVVLVEQNVTLARRLADRVLHMHDGWLAAEPAAEASPA